MKLKLETEDEVTVLTVSENIQAQHLPVLKAGLKKLFGAETRSIVLDLSQLPDASLTIPEVAREIAVLPNWAKDAGAQICVVSNLANLASAPNRAEAVKSLKSPLNRLLALESKLQAQLRALESQKNLILQKMEAAGRGQGDPKVLRKENSDLKKAISGLEESIQRILSKWMKPLEAGAIKLKQENLNGILVSVLEQEGSIPVKVK